MEGCLDQRRACCAGRQRSRAKRRRWQLSPLWDRGERSQSAKQCRSARQRTPTSSKPPRPSRSRSLNGTACAPEIHGCRPFQESAQRYLLACWCHARSCSRDAGATPRGCLCSCHGSVQSERGGVLAIPPRLPLLDPGCLHRLSSGTVPHAGSPPSHLPPQHPPCHIRPQKGGNGT